MPAATVANLSRNSNRHNGNCPAGTFLVATESPVMPLGATCWLTTRLEETVTPSRTWKSELVALVGLFGQVAMTV